MTWKESELQPFAHHCLCARLTWKSYYELYHVKIKEVYSSNVYILERHQWAPKRSETFHPSWIFQGYVQIYFHFNILLLFSFMFWIMFDQLCFVQLSKFLLSVVLFLSCSYQQWGPCWLPPYAEGDENPNEYCSNLPWCSHWFTGGIHQKWSPGTSYWLICFFLFFNIVALMFRNPHYYLRQNGKSVLDLVIQDLFDQSWFEGFMNIILFSFYLVWNIWYEFVHYSFLCDIAAKPGPAVTSTGQTKGHPQETHGKYYTL